MALVAMFKGSQTQAVGPLEFLWQTTKDIAEERVRKKVKGGGDFVDRLNELRAEGTLTDQQAFAQGIGFFQVRMHTFLNQFLKHNICC